MEMKVVHASYLIAGMGPVGLAVDLVWLTTDVVVGDALSAKINNFVTVECTNGVTLAKNNVFAVAKYQADANGNVIIVNLGTEKSLDSRMMMDFNIFARQWTESKYLTYLQDDGWFFDEGDFLYKEEDSEEKAKANITKLIELNQKY